MKQIDTEVGRRTDELLGFIMDLVRIPTVNQPPCGDEAAGQHFLANALKNLGFIIDIFDCTDVEGFERHPLYWPGIELKGRPNMVATWRGTGGGRSLLFSSHMDVCPAVPMPWEKGDPFVPYVEGGKLFGRGAGDMKGGMAAAFMAIRILHDLGFSPRGDIIFESVVDEEFAGANGTLACRLRGYKADLCINPEPTNMVICPATLGAKIFRITVPGTAGMPYTGQLLYNPVFALGKVINILRQFETVWNQRFEDDPRFRDRRIPLNAILWQVKAGELAPQEQMGTPKDAWVSVAVQTPPGVSEEEFDAVFNDFFWRSVRNDPEIAEHRPLVEKTYRYMHTADTPFSHPAVKAVSHAFEETTGKPPKVGVAPFSCDLFLFQRCKSGPAICFGPRSENLHAAEECVHIEDVVALTKIFARLIVTWTGQRKEEKAK